MKILIIYMDYMVETWDDSSEIKIL
jgi:hypothetical protein